MLGKDLARNGRLRIVVSQHGAFDLAAVDACFNHNPRVELKRIINGVRQLFFYFDLFDSQRKNRCIKA